MIVNNHNNGWVMLGLPYSLKVNITGIYRVGSYSHILPINNPGKQRHHHPQQQPTTTATIAVQLYLTLIQPHLVPTNWILPADSDASSAWFKIKISEQRSWTRPRDPDANPAIASTSREGKTQHMRFYLSGCILHNSNKICFALETANIQKLLPKPSGVQEIKRCPNLRERETTLGEN